MTHKKNESVESLVIGDCHGHDDRLRALLRQEDIIDDNGRRVNHDIEIIQLGDLGHFGATGSAHGDLECYRKVGEWIDTLLWGNHDRALVDYRHRFNGQWVPEENLEVILKLLAKISPKFAVARHGHLITHAGLHPSYFKAFEGDATQIAAKLNQNDGRGNTKRVINDVGYERGGNTRHGGILWRDISEDLDHRIPQIFGHSASWYHEIAWVEDSVCIDIGGKGDKVGDNCLAGIYLPSKKVVRVDL